MLAVFDLLLLAMCRSLRVCPCVVGFGVRRVFGIDGESEHSDCVVDRSFYHNVGRTDNSLLAADASCHRVQGRGALRNRNGVWGGAGPNLADASQPKALPTFCEKSKGMALCSRFVMIRLEGGENE